MKLNQIFTSSMVFQANKPIRIFGEGKGKVSVEFVGLSATETFDTDKWCIQLPEMDYGGPYEMKISLNNEIITLQDIYIGEVYLLAGQSNIELSLENTNYPSDLYEENSLLRCFMQDRVTISPNMKSSDGWYVLNKDNAKFWSAIGYHSALKIAESKSIAVGLVYCYKGASVIESWLPEETAKKYESEIPFEERGLMRSSEKDAEHNKSGKLYSVTQQKIVPFSFSAVIWYQGESNTGTGDYKIYGRELKELISCWRKDFKDEKLPFIVVAIADYDARPDEGWKKIQEIQLSSENREDNIISVKSADVCESFDIHPPTKTALAERITDILLSKFN